MNITLESLQMKVPVTIMKLAGTLDASSYLKLIEFTKDIFHTGMGDLLIDLEELTFMSSSGIFALHSIALLMRGEAPLDPQDGWNAFHSIEHFVEAGGGFERHVKLLRPNPRVLKTLETTSFAQVFEVFSDRDAAIASFQLLPMSV